MTFEGEKTYLELDDPFESDSSKKHCRHELSLSKDLFLQSIKSLYIEEWLTNYDVKNFGYIIYDGTQWELKIYFSDRHKPFKVYGDNNYPYNFDDLYELLSFDKTESSLF